MTGDIGEFWRDVRDARKAAGLPARRGHKRPAEPPPKSEVKALKAAGFRQCSDWHWQKRIGSECFDYWPSKGKWRWLGKNATGSVADLLAALAKAEAVP